MGHSQEAALHHWLSPYKDTTSQTRHFPSAYTLWQESLLLAAEDWH